MSPAYGVQLAGTLISSSYAAATRGGRLSGLPSGLAVALSPIDVTLLPSFPLPDCFPRFLDILQGSWVT